MLEILDLVTVLDVFGHDQIHIKAQIHLAGTTNQDLLLVMDSQSMSMHQDHAVIPGDLEWRLERMTKIPIFNVF